MDTSKIEYIKNQRVLGNSDEYITNELRLMQCDDATISQLFAYVDAPVQVVNTAVQTPTLVGYQDMFSAGWHLIIGNLRFIGGAVLAGILGFILFGLAFGVVGGIGFAGFFSGMGATTFIFLALLVLVGFAAFSYYWSVLCVAIMRGLLHAQESKSIWAHIQESWKYGIPFMIVSVYASIFINGGMYLLLIPGIVAMVYFGMSYFVVADENRRGIIALVRSAHLVRGNWWGVLGRMLSVLLVVCGVGFMSTTLLSSATGGFMAAVHFAVAMTCVVGGLFWMCACMAVLFRSLQAINTSAVFDGENHQTLVWILRSILIGLGLLLVFGAMFIASFIADWNDAMMF